MNVTNLPCDELLSLPKKLTIDDTGIVWRHKALMSVLFLIYNLLAKGLFSRSILNSKVADMAKLESSLFGFIFFGGILQFGSIQR